MINYQFSYENDEIKEIIIKGHALFSNYGNDIVCASVSTMIILTVNAITKLDGKDNIKKEIKDGFFNLTVLNNNKTIKGLLENLLYSLNDLSEQYPNHLMKKE